MCFLFTRTKSCEGKSGKEVVIGGDGGEFGGIQRVVVGIKDHDD